MLALVRCEVSEGLRPQEATVTVTDYHGRHEFIPMDRGMLTQEDGTYYMPAPVIHIDPRAKAALISLPIESDSGAHRIWVKLADVRNLPAEVLG